MTDIVERLEWQNDRLRAAMDLREEDHRQKTDEIERLRDQINANRADLEREISAHVTTIQTLYRRDAEIERLRQQVTQRGARMQVMRDYLTRYSGPSTTLWRDFCRVCPEAAAWFDEEGVPR